MKERMADVILTGMAAEVRSALISRGLDPKNPPLGSEPPAERAFEEYQARGGKTYMDADVFMQALLKEIANGS